MPLCTGVKRADHPSKRRRVSDQRDVSVTVTQAAGGRASCRHGSRYRGDFVCFGVRCRRGGIGSGFARWAGRSVDALRLAGRSVVRPRRGDAIGRPFVRPRRCDWPVGATRLAGQPVGRSVDAIGRSAHRFDILHQFGFTVSK